jgi:transcriptional regulator with XRE-family HTH domain
MTQQLGKYLQGLREKAGFSQKEVSLKLGYETAQFVSNWERGLCTPPMNTIRTLSKMFHVDSAKLFETILESDMKHFEEKRREAFKKAR